MDLHGKFSESAGPSSKGKLYSVIYEVREDMDGDYYHLVTLWKSTKQEEKLYDQSR